MRKACRWTQSMLDYLLLVVQMYKSNIGLRVLVYYDKKIKLRQVLEVNDILGTWLSFLDLDLDKLLLHVGVSLAYRNTSWIVNHDWFLAGLIGLEFEVALISLANKHIGDDWVLLSNATEILVDLNTSLSVLLELNKIVKVNCIWTFCYLMELLFDQESVSW